jgi:hypothetical protein
VKWAVVVGAGESGGGVAEEVLEEFETVGQQQQRLPVVDLTLARYYEVGWR